MIIGNAIMAGVVLLPFAVACAYLAYGPWVDAYREVRAARMKKRAALWRERQMLKIGDAEERDVLLRSCDDATARTR